jgi:hypothetical protein
MKSFSLKAILTLVTLTMATPVPEGASPFEIISSRPITERDMSNIEERGLSNCPAGGGAVPPGTVSPSPMVPVSRNLPDTKFGPSIQAIVTPNDFCTIINLDLGPAGVGKTCSLEFLFPDHLQTLAPYAYFVRNCIPAVTAVGSN